jgi:hypothetical protein
VAGQLSIGRRRKGQKPQKDKKGVGRQGEKKIIFLYFLLAGSHSDRENIAYLNQGGIVHRRKQGGKSFVEFYDAIELYCSI